MDNGKMSYHSKELICEIDHYLNLLFPINRSITGNGNRETLKILKEIAPLQIKEYFSGTPVYDWVIPDEWQVRDAWIKDPKGKKIIDFQKNNIHLVSYSEPVNKRIPFDELKSHIYTSRLPDAIPYRTTYYERDWGFCVTHSQYKELEEVKGPLQVHIDSEFKTKGSLTIGELLIPGEKDSEILISTYICHPSLANDNLSGMVMTAFLARELIRKPKLKRSLRIIWVPETIGAIAYSKMNEEKIEKIESGLVVTTVGGPGKFAYKQSFDSMHSINAVIEEVFENEGIDYIVYPFDIHGSDERQYSSQGFLINIASITKDKYYEYEYYHTSLDNLDFVKPEYVEKSLSLYLKVIEKLNDEPVYRSKIPKCEVMLSKHNLYPKKGGAQLPKLNNYSELDIILWLLWLCDGKNGLVKITKKLDVDFEMVLKLAKKLEKKGILELVI